MVQKKRVIAFLLAFILMFGQFMPVAQAVGSLPSNTPIEEKYPNMVFLEAGFDEEAEKAKFLEELPATRSLSRMRSTNTEIDWGSITAKMQVRLTTNAQGGEFLWDQVFEDQDVTFSLTQYDPETHQAIGEPVSITATEPGTIEFPGDFRIYNDNGKKYRNAISLSDSIIMNAVINPYTAGGELGTTTYTIPVNLNRVASTEITAEWHTNNTTNPQLYGKFSVDEGVYNYLFKVPTVNDTSTVLFDRFTALDKDQPMIPAEVIATVSDGTGNVPDGMGGFYYDILIDGAQDDKITAGEKTYFIETSYHEITGGKYVFREAMTVTFDKGEGTTEVTPAEITVPMDLTINQAAETFPDAGIELPAAPTAPEGKAFVGWVTGIGTAEEAPFTADTVVSDNVIVTAKYSEDIIADPEDPDNPITPPAGYVTVEFASGDNGTFAEGAVKKYYVNPEAGKTLADITKPGIVANTGWTHTGWDPEVAEGATVTTDATYTATYVSSTAPQPTVDNEGNPAKYGYKTDYGLTFTGTGEKGAEITVTLADGTTKKTVNVDEEGNWTATFDPITENINEVIGFVASPTGVDTTADDPVQDLFDKITQAGKAQATVVQIIGDTESEEVKADIIRLDVDEDKLYDDEEQFIYKTRVKNRDTDGDLLLDGQEVYGTKNVIFDYKPTNPKNRDTDGDLKLDFYEINNNLNPNSAWQ